MEGGGKEGNIAEGQTLKRLMEKTFPASLRRKRCKHVDPIDECVCLFLEVASALLYIKTLHISVLLVLLCSRCQGLMLRGKILTEKLNA